jgi:hypothetical protein
MGTLLDLSKELKNSPVQAKNKFVNYVKNQMGQAEVNNFDEAKQAVGTEMMRVFRQVNASEVETKAWEERFNSALSPAQIEGAVKTGVKLLGGRASELNNLWNSGMGTTKGYPNLISPTAQRVLASHGYKLEGTEEAPTAKTGPPIGTEKGGYKFTGGDPSDKANWKKVL